MFISKRIAWCAWLIAAIFYAYQFILRVIPNIILNDIMQQFNMDEAMFGQFSGIYYLGYCLMHVPVGIMLDRYGPRKIMSICVLLTALGMLPMIFAKHWILPIIGRFLVGAGSSGAILGVFKIIRIVFDEKYFARMLSFAVTIGLVGAIYGGAPVSYLCETYGYETVIKFLAGMGVVLACIMYSLVPEINTDRKDTLMSGLKSVFTNKKVILVCCLAGFMVGPLEGFADAWGSEFLKQVYSFDPKTANSVVSMIYMGMCFAPVLSSIAEKNARYIETIIGAGIIMLVTFTILVFGEFNIRFMTVAFFIVGICCAYQILAIYKASTYVPERIAGLTTAVANMVIMSFGYVFHSTIGLVIKIYKVNGESASFVSGVSFVPIMLFVAVIGFSLVCLQERGIFYKNQVLDN